MTQQTDARRPYTAEELLGPLNPQEQLYAPKQLFVAGHVEWLRQERRVSVALEPWLRPEHVREYAARLSLSHEDARRLVSMGPSARHIAAPELARRVAALPQPLTVTAAVRVARYAGR